MSYSISAFLVSFSYILILGFKLFAWIEFKPILLLYEKTELSIEVSFLLLFNKNLTTGILILLSFEFSNKSFLYFILLILNFEFYKSGFLINGLNNYCFILIFFGRHWDSKMIYYFSIDPFTLKFGIFDFYWFKDINYWILFSIFFIFFNSDYDIEPC